MQLRYPSISSDRVRVRASGAPAMYLRRAFGRDAAAIAPHPIIWLCKLLH